MQEYIVDNNDKPALTPDLLEQMKRYIKAKKESDAVSCVFDGGHKFNGGKCLHCGISKKEWLEFYPILS